MNGLPWSVLALLGLERGAPSPAGVSVPLAVGLAAGQRPPAAPSATGAEDA